MLREFSYSSADRVKHFKTNTRSYHLVSFVTNFNELNCEYASQKYTLVYFTCISMFLLVFIFLVMFAAFCQYLIKMMMIMLMMMMMMTCYPTMFFAVV